MEPPDQAGSVAAMTADLVACLDAAEPVAALLAFRPQALRVAGLPRLPGQYDTLVPHPLAGLCAMLVSGALQQAGRGREIDPFLNQIADLFAPAHRYYRPGSNLGDFLFRFPFLNVPLLKGALAGKDQDDAISLFIRYGDGKDAKLDWIVDDPSIAAILAHPRAHEYGPFRYDRAWVLEHQEAARALGPMDGRLQRVVDFDQMFLESALMIGQPERGLSILGPNGQPDDAFLARAHLEHLGFNAVCLLAALGRNGEALKLARHIVRRGYRLRWRFDLKAAAGMGWTQEMRQNEWLAELAGTPDYKAFCASDIQWVQHDPNDATQTPVCSVREGNWGGKKKTKCFISRTAIMPGDAVTRIRRMRGCNGFDDFDIASKAGLRASPWQPALDEFEANSVPLARMFGLTHNCGVNWHDPDISAFHYDTVAGPETVDIARAVAIIAAHDPPPVRRTWVKGPERHDRYHLAFDPWAADCGHGEPLTLVWFLIKAGYRDSILAEVARLPAAGAGKVFAMLATFDDPVLRAAAAQHFALPELPAMMATVFASRLTLEQHLAIAAFGRDHTRYRQAIACAMQSYGLHLYSNYAPTADWALLGLEHYGMAHGCRLLLLLTHRPEDDAVLAAMIETGWLPDGVSAGAVDAYQHTAHYYYRTASLHVALDAPGRFAVWMDRSWIKTSLTMAVDRETFRLLETLSKAAKKRARRPASEAPEGKT